MYNEIQDPMAHMVVSDGISCVCSLDPIICGRDEAAVGRGVVSLTNLASISEGKENVSILQVTRRQKVKKPNIFSTLEAGTIHL